MDTFTVVISIILVLVLAFVLVFGIIGTVEEENAKVEAVVVSCEKGDYEPNPGLKAMATMSFIKGQTANAISQNNLANIGAQKYIVVVEYEGVQYEYEMNHKYEVGETIRVLLPEQN